MLSNRLEKTLNRAFEYASENNHEYDDLVVSDAPCIKQMIDVYKKHKCNIIAIQEVDKNNISKYGVIDFLNIKKQIPNYKKMIWETLIDNLIYVSATKIKISFNNLMKLGTCYLLHYSCFFLLVYFYLV